MIAASRGALLCAVIAAVVLAAAPSAWAGDYDVTFEGETMTLPTTDGDDFYDSAASGQSAQRIWNNGTARTTVSTTRPTDHFFVKVRGYDCQGPPEIAVKLDGKQFFAGPVSTSGYKEIGARTSLATGSHTVEISMTNNFDWEVGGIKICDRSVLIDTVTLVATPFSPTGWRNAPLPDATPTAPNSTAMVGDLLRQIDENPRREPRRPGVWMTTHGYSHPVYTVPRDQPTVKVDAPDDNPNLQTQWDAVPLPPDAKPATGTDGALVVWQPSTDTLWDFWQLRKDALGNWAASYGGRMQNVSKNPGHWLDPPDGPGRRYGATATSIALMAGTPRIEELKRGVIEHALDFSIRGGQGYDGWCWPAQRTDNTPGHTRTDSAAIPAGTRFRFPASLNLASYNLHPFALMMARAIQRYGMVLRDGGDGFGFWGEDFTPLGADPYPAMWATADHPEGLYPDEGGVFKNMPWDKLEALAQPSGADQGCQRDPDDDTPR